LAERSGEVFDFHTELAVVNAAHGESDKRLLENLQANRFTIADRIAATIETQEKGAARELIRGVDSRTVIVHPDPGRIENPWAYEGFGLFRGSLFGAFDGLQALAEELGQDWTLMTADPLPEEESPRERTAWQWRPILNEDDLVGALILAVNPRLATYSPETGFRLGVPGHGTWASPPRERDRERPTFAPYHRETFQKHQNFVYEHKRIKPAGYPMEVYHIVLRRSASTVIGRLPRLAHRYKRSVTNLHCCAPLSRVSKAGG